MLLCLKSNMSQVDTFIETFYKELYDELTIIKRDLSPKEIILIMYK